MASRDENNAAVFHGIDDPGILPHENMDVDSQNNFHVSSSRTYETGNVARPNLEISRPSALSIPESPVLSDDEASCSSDTLSKNPRLDDQVDGKVCPICLDSWTNSGDHRLCCLKCGHLFGYKCVYEWLRRNEQKNRRCPTCKSIADIAEIRCLFVKDLVAVDNRDLVELQSKYETVEAENNRLKLQLHASQLANTLLKREIGDLHKQIETSKHSATRQSNNVPLKPKFGLEKNVELAEDRSCRVLTYNSRKCELYVAHKQTSTLFKTGYGIRKVDCERIDSNINSFPFYFLHPSMIRDISYCPMNNLVLSVGLDKAAKLFSPQSNQKVASIQNDSQLWSCTWDLLDNNIFYIGGGQSTVKVHDVRQPEIPLNILTTNQDKSQVVSLQSTEFGLACCLLTRCMFYPCSNGVSREEYTLTDNGPFLSMSYDKDVNQLLVSVRPNSKLPRTSHELYSMEKSPEDNVQFNMLHKFLGSQTQALMSRSKLLKIGSRSLVAAYNESEQELCLYSRSDFESDEGIKISDSIVDMCSYKYNNSNFLACLSQGRLRLYSTGT